MRANQFDEVRDLQGMLCFPEVVVKPIQLGTAVTRLFGRHGPKLLGCITVYSIMLSLDILFTCGCWPTATYTAPPLPGQYFGLKPVACGGNEYQGSVLQTFD